MYLQWPDRAKDVSSGTQKHLPSYQQFCIFYLSTRTQVTMQEILHAPNFLGQRLSLLCCASIKPVVEKGLQADQLMAI